MQPAMRFDVEIDLPADYTGETQPPFTLICTIHDGETFTQFIERSMQESSAFATAIETWCLAHGFEPKGRLHSRVVNLTEG